jgi:Ca2+:H+ antiporter
VEVVKATITGSIISNLLLVMGFSMFLGGLKYKEQTFGQAIVQTNSSLMNLAVIALLVPTAVQYTSTGIEEGILQNLSVAVSIILILVYASTLLFSMKTHSYLYDVGVAAEDEDDDGEADHKPNLTLWVTVLLLCTLAVAVESELLVESLEEATSELGLTALFTGVIVLPIIGNAAEHATAVTVAIKNKMDLSISVAVGSSMQIALFVAPVLVIAGWLIGQPMDLNFNPFELVAVAVSVLIVNSINADGKSNWLEGSLLLATYGVLGLAFFFHPVVAGLG